MDGPFSMKFWRKGGASMVLNLFSLRIEIKINKQSTDDAIQHHNSFDRIEQIKDQYFQEIQRCRL